MHRLRPQLGLGTKFKPQAHPFHPSIQFFSKKLVKKSNNCFFDEWREKSKKRGRGINQNAKNSQLLLLLLFLFQLSELNIFGTKG